MKNVLFLTVAVSFASCASYSGIVQIGEGKMVITKQAATGFSGLGNMKAELLADAANYCQAQNLALRVVGISETQPPYILGNYPRTELVFTCAGPARTGMKVDA
jgi:hypothetical protein